MSHHGGGATVNVKRRPALDGHTIEISGLLHDHATLMAAGKAMCSDGDADRLTPLQRAAF
jgi:hypothetical protein